MCSRIWTPTWISRGGSPGRTCSGSWARGGAELLETLDLAARLDDAGDYPSLFGLTQLTAQTPNPVRRRLLQEHLVGKLPRMALSAQEIIGIFRLIDGPTTDAYLERLGAQLSAAKKPHDREILAALVVLRESHGAPPYRARVDAIVGGALHARGWPGFDALADVLKAMGVDYLMRDVLNDYGKPRSGPSRLLKRSANRFEEDEE
jgi:hypothetical protein